MHENAWKCMKYIEITTDLCIIFGTFLTNQAMSPKTTNQPLQRCSAFRILSTLESVRATWGEKNRSWMWWGCYHPFVVFRVFSHEKTSQKMSSKCLWRAQSYKNAFFCFMTDNHISLKYCFMTLVGFKLSARWHSKVYSKCAVGKRWQTMRSFNLAV